MSKLIDWDTKNCHSIEWCKEKRHVEYGKY